MKQPRTILVTGCAGFIGSRFVNQFINKFPKTTVVGIDDFSTGRKGSLHSSIVFYEGSILNEKLLEKIFSKHRPDYVFHFAALPRIAYSFQFPKETRMVNILGTLSLLEASHSHKVTRFIFSSSSSVYGDADEIPTRESDQTSGPKSPYAVQKYIGELFCKIYSEQFNLDTVCLRYFNVFGPGQYGNDPHATIISAWLESIYFPKNKQAFIEGDGNQSRDFCFVDNVVQANILAMQRSKPGNGMSINIGHGSHISMNTVKKLVEKITEKKLDLKKYPRRIADIHHTCAAISKAQKELGYCVTTDFESGLKETILWFQSRKE